MTPGGHNPIPNVTVVIKKKSSHHTHPLVITVAVTNHTHYHATFPIAESPLDPMALQLGLIRVTIRGHSQPVEYPHIKLKREWPPTAEGIICLAPGESKERDVELKHPPLPLAELKGKQCSVQIVGRWRAMFGRESEHVTLQDWDGMGDGAPFFSGDYASAPVEEVFE